MAHIKPSTPKVVKAAAKGDLVWELTARPMAAKDMTIKIRPIAEVSITMGAPMPINNRAKKGAMPRRTNSPRQLLAERWRPIINSRRLKGQDLNRSK
jgi:hypothetical protein